MAKDPLLPQLELGPRIGGLKELATRLSFYNGIANSLMVAALYYGQNPTIPVANMKLHAIAPTILAFYGILLLGLAFLGVWEHVFVIRAQAEYNQVQHFNEGVSPIRRHLASFEQDTENRLENIEDKLDQALNEQ